jgi:hypothetical protein
MRYYGSEKNHTAIQVLESSDGYSLLSNVEIPIDETTTVGYKIKLIKTDLDGNQQWEKSYPEFTVNNSQDELQNNFHASSFIQLANSGYLIIGDRINIDKTTDLLLLHLDQEGNMLDSATISGKTVNLAGASLHGAAVLENQSSLNSNYTVLARIEWPTTTPSMKDMFLAEVSVSDYSINWKREYGAGQGSLINKIITTPDNNFFWGGSVLSYGQHDIRLVKSPADSDLPNVGSPLLTAEEEIANDFCPVPGGYVVTGSTNAGGDEDIFIMKVNPNAGLVFSKALIDNELDFGLNDRGNSITIGKDGALMVLATVASATTQEDLCLIKVNPATGNVMWKNNFGGADREDGASVITLGDGSFLIYGTSYFGRVKKLMLIKVKSDGQL